MPKHARATQRPTVATGGPSHPLTQPATPSPVHPVRKIPELQRLLLTVRAGGRCEFDGHNKYLFRHSLTLTEGNFSQTAHIVAFRMVGRRR